MGKKTYLYLEDGSVLTGESFGYDGESDGEVVFSTGMTGYVESLTDPSFAGQILTFTYPLMGNYGVPTFTMQDTHLVSNAESERIWAKGVVIGSLSPIASHYTAHATFSDWLAEQKIPGIMGIDTRSLTLKLREHGVMKGRISPSKSASAKDISIPTSWPDVSIKEVITYKPTKPNGKTIALLDCGVKHGIIRALTTHGYTTIRLPFDGDPLKYPYIVGIFCSNGPGNPKDWMGTVKTIKKALAHNMPFLGVCLGHQLLSLAVGADTYKLKYGHRGINQPCQDTKTKKCYVTSQNHGYAVKTDTIPKDFSEWFINLNDRTNEGIHHKNKPIRSVQFHPEGHPGPFDTEWIFDLL
jgi:carbamoyl-phosphate synthase small subunit